MTQKKATKSPIKTINKATTKLKKLDRKRKPEIFTKRKPTAKPTKVLRNLRSSAAYIKNKPTLKY